MKATTLFFVLFPLFVAMSGQATSMRGADPNEDEESEELDFEEAQRRAQSDPADSVDFGEVSCHSNQVLIVTYKTMVHISHNCLVTCTGWT